MAMDRDAEELAARARKFAESSGESIKEAISSIQDSEQWEEISAAAKKISAEAAEVVRKYPLQSVAGAALLGLLVGALFGRRRGE